MSWSIYAIGKPAAVHAKILNDLTASKCAEPEETVKQAAGAAILAAVGAQAANSVVRVEANGHQTTIYDSGKPTGEFQNTLNIKVEPIPGFIE